MSKVFLSLLYTRQLRVLGEKRGNTYGSAVSLFMISWQIFDSKLQRTCKLHHFSAPSPLPSPLAGLSAPSSRSCSRIRFGLWFRRHPSWTFHVLSSQFQVAKTKTVIISCIVLSKYSCCFETEWLTLRAVFPIVIPDSFYEGGCEGVKNICVQN